MRQQPPGHQAGQERSGRDGPGGDPGDRVGAAAALALGRVRAPQQQREQREHHALAEPVNQEEG
jgi:hypothetical protein